jgi:VanZ family protein
MTYKYTSKFFLYLFVIGWAVFIFYSSTAIFPLEHKKVVFSDKIIHFFQYGILAWLLFKTINTNFINLSFRRIFLLVLLIGFFYGVGIECYQYFLPFRSFSFLDMGANLLGLIVPRQLNNSCIQSLNQILKIK